MNSMVFKAIRLASRTSTRAAPPSPLVLHLPVSIDVPLPSSPRSPINARQSSTRSLPASPRSSTTPGNVVRPQLVLRKSEPGPSASAGLMPKRGILKPNSSPSSPSSTGAGQPTEVAACRPSPSLPDGWTPPTPHGIIVKSVDQLAVTSQRRVRVKRSTPSLPKLSFDAHAIDLPAAASVAFEPASSAVPIVAAPATNLVPMLRHRMNDANLIASTEQLKPLSPSLSSLSPSLLESQLDLSTFRRRGGIGETPRVNRTSPAPVGRGLIKPLLARNDSVGSSGSSAGLSVRSAALREKRKARVRARTVGAYDINDEQLLCEVVGAPPQAVAISTPSRNTRLARPETQLHLLPSSTSASSSAPGSRPVTPNTAWRQSLFAEVVGQSLRSSSAGSSISYLPSPPTPSELPLLAKSPLKHRILRSRRATLSNPPVRATYTVNADRAVLAPTPDLLGELPTVRRQASRPLLSDSLRDSVASSHLFDNTINDGPISRQPLSSFTSGGTDFGPNDFENCELYASVGSSDEPLSTLSSSSSRQTLNDLPTAADTTGVSIYGDEVEADEHSERGTPGQRRGKGCAPLIIQVTSPVETTIPQNARTPRLREAGAQSPLASRFRRSISGLPSATDASTTGRFPVEVAWATRNPSTATTGSLYGIASSTVTESTAKLSSQDATPGVPSTPSTCYHPATTLLQDLDPRLPITNTVPRLPPSPSTVLKGMFTRRRQSKYHAPSGLSSADPAPSLGIVFKRSGLATVPVSAFSSSDEIQPPTPPPTPADSEDRTVAAWAATTAARDPSISRLEGLLHQHQELERERLRRIIEGPSRPIRSPHRIAV